jgi:hypothetical protein
VRSRFAGIMPVTLLQAPRQPPQSRLSHQRPHTQAFLLHMQERGKKISEGKGVRPQVSWPMALRAVRGWLEPWIMRHRAIGMAGLNYPHLLRCSSFSDGLNEDTPLLSLVQLDPKSTNYR